MGHILTDLLTFCSTRGSWVQESIVFKGLEDNFTFVLMKVEITDFMHCSINPRVGLLDNQQQSNIAILSDTARNYSNFMTSKGYTTAENCSGFH